MGLEAEAVDRRPLRQLPFQQGQASGDALLGFGGGVFEPHLVEDENRTRSVAAAARKAVAM